MTNQCQHGHLARVCLTCEHEATIAALTAENARLRLLEERLDGITKRAIEAGWDVDRPEDVAPLMQVEIDRLREELANERRAAWEAVNKWIKIGPLPGNGCDEQAQRNGMILAANLLHQRIDFDAMRKSG